MTGTLHSEPSTLHRAAAAFGLLCAAAITPLSADDLTLAGDARLTGTVRAISADGSVELDTQLSPAPLVLKGEAVRRVVFSEPEDMPDPPTSRIELVNGDVFPCVIESLEDDRLTVSSPVAGRLVIPRAVVKSLQLGLYRHRPIYSGPTSMDGWTKSASHGGSNPWLFDQGALRIEGAGRLSRDLDLPEQYVIRFMLNWRNNPNIRLFFSDPLVSINQQADRYLFQFGVSGLEIKRESTTGRRYTTIAALTRPPDQFPGNRMAVELRVDRKRGLIHLYLNGEYEGRHQDPVPNVPKAGGITFDSNAPNSTEHRISQIEILAWDAAGDRHRTEERGDEKMDALIGRRAERWGGRLKTIRKTPDGPVFVFKSDFQESPIELPESEVSTVFFKTAEPPVEVADDPAFSLRLLGNGSLKVTSCTFSGDAIQVRHPLLGGLQLERGGVSAFERARPVPKAKPVKEP